ALALLTRAQRLAPSDARIHRARGWVIRRLGRYEEAVDAFERSLALDPLGAEGWKVLDSYMHARRYDRLLEIARRLAAEDPQGSAIIATWWEVTVAAVRDGDLTGANRMLEHWPAIFHTSYVDDPRVNAPWSTWLLGLNDTEIASLASGVEDLLPSAGGSPLSLSFALAFRAWALHDVLGHPDARDAALAYERAADGMLATANTPQLAVGILGQRAMNYLRLGEPERAVALADSLTRAFPPGLDEWWSSPQARRVRAAVYARVGRQGEAIDILKPLVPPPSHYTLALLRIDPTWEPLRSHPRWAEILEAAR
ncbi:MAG TPA: tetratricopeptide repeat protein, partial [Candidatus Limnocylindrales bacterium]|nr:tetratricopeptide repeat protein [Candidatus Limnocylindrales bacterium]